MKAYKGFDKDMKCRGFQYEAGKEYETDTAKLCECGFHACKDPINVFRYYPPGAGSKYHEVELEDVSSEQNGEDTKVVGKKIKIGAEIGIPGIMQAHIQYVNENVKKSVEAGDAESISVGDKMSASAGEFGSASAGEYGSASAGEFGSASAGEYGSAVSRGQSSVGANGAALARGNGVKARGGLGAILVIAEENEDNYEIKSWCAGVVNGETIKADTWYKCENGQFVECEDG